MKKAIVRFSSLFAIFILVAATYATFAVQPAAQKTPQGAIPQCYSRCSGEHKICLQRAGDSERRKQRCYFDNRRCVAKCKPQATPGE